MEIFGKRFSATPPAAEHAEPPWTGSLSIDLPNLSEWQMSYHLGINRGYELSTLGETYSDDEEGYFKIEISGALVTSLRSEDWENHLGIHGADEDHHPHSIWKRDLVRISIEPPLELDNLDDRKVHGHIGDGSRSRNKKKISEHGINLNLTNDEIRNILRILELPNSEQDRLASMHLKLTDMVETKNDPISEVHYYISGIQIYRA